MRIESVTMKTIRKRLVNKAWYTFWLVPRTHTIKHYSTKYHVLSILFERSRSHDALPKTTIVLL
jgi:hypothetical protein